ncbi:ATP-binding protein [Streptomyces halobius]|uniref:ATP-binding protein n=1 Tax=Streptomyces halobius TaxID=2879846 RepID=A0ABY4LZA7_9ACTN|nr:ATP-binding protein [Streptomyces halobius]UQA90837.1 ATP-binding protein [Streptomyces halobius]
MRTSEGDPLPLPETGAPSRSRLYGRDPLLRSLLPRLTGLAYGERSRAPREHRGDLPVVLVTGHHGMGRSAVLTALAAHYRDRLPLAHVRAVATEPGTFPPVQADGTAAASTFVEILAELVCGLAPGLRRRFPVLTPGLFAVSGWRLGNAEQRDAVCLRYARLLRACRLADGDENALRHTWATAVEGRLEAVGAAESQDAMAAAGQDAVTAAVVAEYAERYQPAAAQEWYRRRFPRSAEGQDPLVLLGEWFQQGGDFRHAAEQSLMAAFLHDVASSYGRLQRWNREPRPLVLLDDAHRPAGQDFLDLLLEHRAMPERPGHEELVVVATRLGGLPENAPAAIRRDLPDLVTSSGWERQGLAPSAGLLAVPLAPLSRDDILPLLVPDRPTRPLHPYLASAVHSLTGGHPAATTVLCAAVLDATKKGVSVAPRNLLELRTPDGRPVTEALLERLLPDRRQRDRLTLLSLARDSTAAEALAGHLRLQGPDQLPANSATDYLEEQQWQQLTPPDRPLVTDALLQTLLVHEARRTSRGADDGRGWQEIHRFLRMHHAQRGESGEADALRHTLAAGNAETVVATLAEEFQSEQDAQAAAHWLRCLRYAATAPTPPAPPAGEWTDERTQVALGAHDGRYAELHEIERCINRLLHALWQVSEPHAEPDPDLCKAVGEELAFLSPRHPSWHAVLGQAARSWPAAARKKLPFPVPGQ